MRADLLDTQSIDDEGEAMAGQPLSTLRTNGNYFFGTDVLVPRPNSMALISIAVAGWSITEAHLGNAFAALIGATKPVTMDMYCAFDSFAVQKRLLVTAATRILPKRYSDIFRATLVVLERAATERHKFAHWIWGASADPKFSDTLLLADPVYFWKLRVARIRHMRRFERSGDYSQMHLTTPRLDLKLILAYREPDLRRVCKQMELSWRYADALCELVSSKPPRRQQIYRQLLGQADIRQALEKDRQHHTKRKKASPRLRGE